MTERAKRALNVYSSLNAQERLEFMTEAKKLDSTNPLERKLVLEEVAKATRMTLGPIGGGCPYCGR